MSYESVTIRFREVKYQATKRMWCRVCKCNCRRSRTFIQTINPWNTNAQGVPKTYPEIWKELIAEAEVWQPETICRRCKDVNPKAKGSSS